MDMKNKTVLITGGSSGIGFEMARQLLQRGNTVVVTGRDPGRLDAARRALPDVHTVTSDAADPQAIEALHDQLVAQFPGLDVLINNAGVMRNLRLYQPRSLEDVTREIDIDLKAPIWMVQRFLPHLTRQKEALIVNVSSGLAFVPFPASPIYSAAKAALHAYTVSLRAQLRARGVTVVELAPPGTETPLFRREFEKEMAGEKGMDVEWMVRQAIKGIEAGKLEIRPGLSNVLKIASRVAPQLMLGQMTKMSRLDPEIARTRPV